MTDAGAVIGTEAQTEAAMGIAVPNLDERRRAASVLALLAAIGTLLMTVAMFGVMDALPALQGGSASPANGSGVKLLLVAICLTVLFAAVSVRVRPRVAGVLLFLCSEAIFLVFGLTWVTVAPGLTLAAAGILSVLLPGDRGTEALPQRFLGFSNAQLGAFLGLVFLVSVLPALLYPVFLMKVLCFALFACAFNLLIGYVGLMSFGHAAFFGMGSYLSAYSAKAWGLTPELAILLGGLVGALLGVLFGWLAIRRQGIYFAMITLALAQMNYFFCLQAPFTGGEDGIQQVPRGMLFGVINLRSDMAMYWTVAVVFVAIFLLVHRIVHSPFGQVLKAIRENEPRATSLGYRTDDYKLIAFVLSCFIAGLAGGMKAIVFGIATLTDVNVATSGDVVLMTLLGGMGTIFGPVLGAAVIQTLEQYLAQFGSWVTVTQGVIFVICVLAFRRGIVGEIAAKLRVAL